MMSKEQIEEVTILVAELRGLGVSYAGRLEDLEKLERLADRASSVVWIIDPTLARNKAGAIDRHVRFVRASVVFARAMRELLHEEIAELAGAERARRGGLAG